MAASRVFTSPFVGGGRIPLLYAVTGEVCNALQLSQQGQATFWQSTVTRFNDLKEQTCAETVPSILVSSKSKFSSKDRMRTMAQIAENSFPSLELTKKIQTFETVRNISYYLIATEI